MADQFWGPETEPIEAPKEFWGPETEPVAAPPQEEPGIVSKILETVTAPLAAMDKMTGAPLRAGMGAIQNHINPWRPTWDQFVAGIPEVSRGPTGVGFEVKGGTLLPSTPSGRDIAKKGLIQYGFKPEDADKMATIPGLMTDAALDVTNLIPVGAGTEGVRAGSQVAGEALNAAARAAGALEGGIAKPLFGVGSMLLSGNINYEKALRAAQVLKSYELMAPGTKDFGLLKSSNKAVGEARQALGTAKLTVPGSHDVAQQVLGIMDQAIARTTPALRPGAIDLQNFIKERMFQPTEVPIPIQEIQQSYLSAKNELNRISNQYGQMKDAYNSALAGWAQEKGIEDISHFNPMDLAQLKTAFEKEAPDIAQHMHAAQDGFTKAHDAVDELARGYQSHQAGVPVFTRTELREKDLTLDEIDDIITNVDDRLYTGLGNEKLPKKIWTPAVRQSRRVLNDALNSVPEGELFQELKSRNEGLQAASKGRSKLLDSLGTAGAMRGGIAGLATKLAGGDMGLAALATFAGYSSIKPGTYYRIMGAVKAPGDMIRAVQAAADSGKLAVMRDTIATMAEKYPAATEGLIRGIALASSKPEGRQILTAEDEKNLYKSKSFDPEIIAQTAQRIKDDPDTPSVLKARLLSDIAQNGYVILPNADAHSIAASGKGGNSEDAPWKKFYSPRAMNLSPGEEIEDYSHPDASGYMPYPGREHEPYVPPGEMRPSQIDIGGLNKYFASNDRKRGSGSVRDVIRSLKAGTGQTP